MSKIVTIYGDKGCVWCDRAKDLCKTYGITYEYKMIRDEGVFEELQSKVPGVKTVPQIFWFGKHIGGYAELTIEIEETRNYGDGKI